MEMINYFLRLIPGLILIIAMILVFRRRNDFFLISLFIALFLFTRDTMTPEGLWSFGKEGFFWMRFNGDILTLVMLASSSAVFVVLMYRFAPELCGYIEWFKGNKLLGILLGLGCAFLVVAPVYALYLFTDIGTRGGPVLSIRLPFIFIVAILGNLYEEVLFRGYLQGYLEKKMGFKAFQAAVVSGLAFACGHVFLATSVSDIGWPLLAFALWEGIIAGLVKMKSGVIASTLMHGGAVFILASGLV